MMLSTKAHILDLDLKCKRLRILLLLEKKIITARMVASIQSVNSEEGSSSRPSSASSAIMYFPALTPRHILPIHSVNSSR